ncbi:MAG: sigma-70 family RNA polymerase sigma factor [Phycisphaerales bacterium]|nr:sigma-70 family RNA polymerase sigma factor [Phycisphaerales bacterium]
MEWITTTTVLHDLRDFANEDAWGRFVGRFRAPIASFGRSLGLPGPDAEDLAQQALTEFAAAYRDGRYDRQQGRLSSWLFGIAYRQGLRLLRESRRQPVHDSGLAEAPDQAAATNMWEGEWERAVLGQCIDRVRAEVEPQTFDAFALVVQRGLGPQEAAADLGISIKAVYNAKHRVLRRIRELRAELEATEEEPPRAVP